MNIIINYPKDKTNLEDKVAYIKAVLMQRYIDELNIDNIQKNDIKRCLVEKLQKT